MGTHKNVSTVFFYFLKYFISLHTFATERQLFFFFMQVWLEQDKVLNFQYANEIKGHPGMKEPYRNALLTAANLLK